jgi:hypothetical protein
MGVPVTYSTKSVTFKNDEVIRSRELRRGEPADVELQAPRRG